MNSFTRHLFARLHCLTAGVERSLVNRLWALARGADRAADEELERVADGLVQTPAPPGEYPRAAYVATLCSLNKERRARRFFKGHRH